MLIAFLLEGISIWALYVYGQNPLGFVLLSRVVFFAWITASFLPPAPMSDVGRGVSSTLDLKVVLKIVADVVVPQPGHVMRAMRGAGDSLDLLHPHHRAGKGSFRA
jgi:hypothetical protein